MWGLRLHLCPLYNSSSHLAVLALVSLVLWCVAAQLLLLTSRWPLVPACLFKSSNTIVPDASCKFPLLNYLGWALYSCLDPD